MSCLKWEILQTDYLPFSSSHISMDTMN